MLTNIIDFNISKLKWMLLLILLSISGCQKQPEPIGLNHVEVYFSPNGGCTEAVIDNLIQAKHTILIQAYSFTSAPIARAVLDAHKRGVQVQVILDKSQRTEKYSSADFFVHAGVNVSIDAKHKIAHNKVIVIDSSIVITGSFNFTKSAEESNSENLLVIRDSDLAAKYILNWKKHAEHSEAYVEDGKMINKNNEKPSKVSKE